VKVRLRCEVSPSFAAAAALLHATSSLAFLVILVSRWTA
jgi:hypothetical protein